MTSSTGHEHSRRQQGQVIERLPNATFVVRLDDGRHITCFITRSYIDCRTFIRLDEIFKPGDRVTIELSSFDSTIGRFVRE